ncbi:hypothetical protein [Nocardia stercoris]|uniref:Uncharacterized protein n=1 Tax=Nocardia stercoris TaxID=2483361 RepID=A0A3M2L909_9NOCA|nr:hypothetical protein [Nocardia stercoris]RMI33556.1 hypothetical protein EBN03_10630 [Nocardia stercoris]
MTVTLGHHHTTPDRAPLPRPADPGAQAALHRLREDYPGVPAVMIYAAIAGARADLPHAPADLLPELAERLAWYRLSTVRSLP